MATIAYHPRSRRLHWSMACLVLFAYVSSSFIAATAHGSPERCFVIRTHFMAGLAVLLLLAPRVRNRLRNAPPPIEPPLDGWQVTFADFAHALLYVFLFAQPLLGVLSVWLGGDGIGIPLTKLAIPSPLPAHPAWRARAGELHAWLGTAFYFLIAAHVAGAFWHRYARRDDTLQRMLG